MWPTSRWTTTELHETRCYHVRPTSPHLSSRPPMPPVDNNWIPAVSLGSVLILLACGMLWSHARAWRLQQADLEADEADQAYYRNRYRRRTQTSAFLALVGFLIAIGDVVIWQFGPLASTIFWLMVIVFVCWIAMLALGDLTAVRTHSQSAMARHEAQRRALERELDEYRKRSNGRPIH